MKSLQWVVVAGSLLFFYSCHTSFSSILLKHPSRVEELLHTADSLYRTDSIKFPPLADTTVQRLLVKPGEPFIIDDSFPPNIMISTHDLLNIIFQKGDISNPRAAGDSLIFQLAVNRDSIDVIRYNTYLHEDATLYGSYGLWERPTLLIRLQTPTDPSKAVAPGRLCPPPRTCGSN